MERQEEILFLKRLNGPLLFWYEEHKRDLPWRKDQDPYHVWVSEIMLQQTRVEAVKPYYARFLNRLPDVRSLAECPEEELLKLWEGLGYYNRVRNMQKAARQIIEDHAGVFPNQLEQIRGLSGIGDYTAGAISSISFKIPEPAVDGNVLRVISRLLAKKENILLPVVKKDITELLRESMPKDVPGNYNQALMELGATVCLPNGTPACSRCPLKEDCQAKKFSLTEELPVRIKKTKRRIEEKTVLLLLDGEQVAIRKRPDTGLLAGLYEFPALSGYADEAEIIAYVESLGFDPLRIRRIDDAKHIFSHVEWRMQGYAVQIDEHREGEEFLFADVASLTKQYALPSAFKVYRKALSEGISYHVYDNRNS